MIKVIPHPVLGFSQGLVEPFAGNQFVLFGCELLVGRERRCLARCDDGYWVVSRHRFITLKSQSRCRVTLSDGERSESLGVMEGFAVSGGVLRTGHRFVATLHSSGRWRTDGEEWAEIRFTAVDDH